MTRPGVGDQALPNVIDVASVVVGMSVRDITSEGAHGESEV